MATKLFPTSYLIDELELPDTCLHSEMVDQGRWTTTYRIVFEDDGRFYRTHYRSGSTENCDESPWQHVDTVTCTEVHQVEQIVKVWLKR